MFEAEVRLFKDARKGPSRKFVQQRFFACEGLICIVDERATRIDQSGKAVEEGDCKVLTPKDFLVRVKAFMRTYRNMKLREMPAGQKHFFTQYQAGAVGGMEAINEAKEMGDPSDPAVQAYWARHRGKPYVSMCSLPDVSNLPKVAGLETSFVHKGVVQAAPQLSASRQSLLSKVLPNGAPTAPAMVAAPAKKLILP